MQIVILAGGLATRLWPLTKKVPKSMIRILGKPFLEYQINLLRKNDIKNIVLCAGYLHEQIEEYFGDGNKLGVHLTYSYEKDKLLDTGGAIKNAEKYLKSDFFVMYGDSYLPIDFKGPYKYFKKHNPAALMVVYKNESRYDKSNVVFSDKFIDVYNKNRQLPEMKYIDYGLTILSKKVLIKIPEGKTYDLANLLCDIANSKELLGYEVYNRFYEIGSLKGIENFKKYVNRGLK